MKQIINYLVIFHIILLASFSVGSVYGEEYNQTQERTASPSNQTLAEEYTHAWAVTLSTDEPVQAVTGYHRPPVEPAKQVITINYTPLPTEPVNQPVSEEVSIPSTQTDNKPKPTTLAIKSSDQITTSRETNIIEAEEHDSNMGNHKHNEELQKEKPNDDAQVDTQDEESKSSGIVVPVIIASAFKNQVRDGDPMPLLTIYNSFKAATKYGNKHEFHQTQPNKGDFKISIRSISIGFCMVLLILLFLFIPKAKIS